MKSLIIYKGKYGATAQYSKWLAEELKFPLHTADDHIDLRSDAAKLVIIGTSIYIGKLQIASWLKENIVTLRDRKLFLFLVSGTPSGEHQKLESYIQNNIPGELKHNMTVFYLPGRLCIARLSWKDRFMLKMGARLTGDAATKKAMLTDYDLVKKENLAPLLNAVRQYCLENVNSLS